ncbi:MAG: hypothetical protein KIT83_04695 [Bryobacterales bacterium]|nr:hypothetical protein [Bryobacterales bacterium]
MRTRWARRSGLGQALFLLLGSAALMAQTEEIRIPFSDPSKPGAIEVNLMTGALRVEGYAGTEVQVVAKGDAVRKSVRPSPEREGLRRLPTGGGGFRAEEKDNVLRISASAMAGNVDLDLRIPMNASLKVRCMNCEAIRVNNTSGGLELENVNGTIQATDVSGAVVAHSLNSKLVVTMRQVDSGKPLAFSSMNGNVDVTLPASTKADVVIENFNGEVLTDFDVELQPNTEREEIDRRGQGGAYRFNLTRNLRGKINGGGTQIRFKNHNGDILIRKAK